MGSKDNLAFLELSKKRKVYGLRKKGQMIQEDSKDFGRLRRETFEGLKPT